MTTRSISNQVKTIKSATEKAAASREAAIAFLSHAGIIASSGMGRVLDKKSKRKSNTSK